MSYAKQKLIDDYSINENLGQSAAHQNYYCRKCDRSVSSNDISQRFVYSAVYQLPFGRGQKFGQGWNPFIDALLGGWQANGILTFQTGFPLNILEGTDTTLGSASAGEQSLRPNNNGQSAGLSGPVVDRLNKYFNTQVFRPRAFHLRQYRAHASRRSRPGHAQSGFLGLQELPRHRAPHG